MSHINKSPIPPIEDENELEELTVPTAPESGTAAIIMLAEHHDIPVEPFQIRHDLARVEGALSPLDICRILKLLGLKTRLLTLDFNKLSRMSFPAIVETIDGNYLVITSYDLKSARFIVVDPETKEKTYMNNDVAYKHFKGAFISVTSRLKFTSKKNLRFGLSWFLPYLTDYRGALFLVLVFSILIQAVALITPLTTQFLIDKVLTTQSTNGLLLVVVAMSGIAVYESLFSLLRAYVFSKTSSRFTALLGTRMFRHLLHLPLNYFVNNQVGQVVSRVRELDGIRHFVTGSALTSAVDTLFACVFLIIMFSYSSILTWIVVATLFAYIILWTLISPIYRNHMQDKFVRDSDNVSYLIENVEGIQTVKSGADNRRANSRWNDKLAASVTAAFRAKMTGTYAVEIIKLINKIAMITVLVFGIKLVMKNELTVGSLVAFRMFAGHITMSIIRLAQVWQEFQQTSVSLNRVGEILNESPEDGFSGGRCSMAKVVGQISFRNVYFSYDSHLQDVLHDISIELEPGKSYGFTGPSGSGKSTLTKLVQRLYVPRTGQVSIDGIDLAMINPSFLRCSIGVVLQESRLFHGSIRENIMIANLGAKPKDLDKVVELSGVSQFLSQMSGGLDHFLGEGGSGLSGGQKQRIAIARALIADPTILIMDEATSALDYESEQIIQQNMLEIAKGRTTLVIAHRLNAIKNVDNIFFIDRGQIIESGSHRDLLKQNGCYAKMWNLQIGKK